MSNLMDNLNNLESISSLFAPNSANTAVSPSDTDTVKANTTDIPLTSLTAFHNHPFNVNDDMDMDSLVDSISKQGLIEPIIVRPLPNSMYEILSGHRRKRAYEILHKDTIPCIILSDITDDDASLIMYSSNIYRTDIKPSEKAKAARIAYEALCNEKKVKEEVGGQVVQNVDEASNIKGLSLSERSLRRLIRLTYLNSGLMAMVDDGRIAENTGVSLSFLKEDEQDMLYEMIVEDNLKVNMTQADKLKELSQSKKLTKEKMKAVLNGEKVRTVKTRVISYKIGRAEQKKIRESVGDISQEEFDEIFEKFLTAYKKFKTEGEWTWE